MKHLPLIVLLLLATLSPAVLFPQEDGQQGPPYYGPDGKEQPATCNGEEHDHPCQCMRNDQTNCSEPGKPAVNADEPGYKCKTYCRKDACSCSMECGS